MKSQAHHNALIDGYVAKVAGASRTGFKAALREHFPHSNLDDLRANPDAFVLEVFDDDDAFAGRLTIVEAQNTYPLKAAKLDRYLGLFWHLDGRAFDDCADAEPECDQHQRPWKMGLHLIERTGSVFEVDVPEVAVRFVNAPPTDPLGVLPGRVKFGHPGNPEGKGVGSPPFGCVLLVWRRS